MRRKYLRKMLDKTTRQMPELRTHLNETPFSVPILQLFFQLLQIVDTCHFNNPTLQLQTPSGVETMLAGRTLFRPPHPRSPPIFASADGTLADSNIHLLTLLHHILILIVLNFCDRITIEVCYRTLLVIQTNAKKPPEG